MAELAIAIVISSAVANIRTSPEGLKLFEDSCVQIGSTHSNEPVPSVDLAPVRLLTRCLREPFDDNHTSWVSCLFKKADKLETKILSLNW